MFRRVARLFGGLVLVLVAAILAFLVAMRSKYPPALDAVRRFNRSVTNPRSLHTAGQPGAYASVIRHVGRTSGNAYETPIGPFATDDGFVIPLPYGTTSDWLKNVQAAGNATIISEGKTYHVSEPALLTGDDGMSSVPHEYQRTLRWFNINDFLRVQTIESQDT
jgi:deazaflavin-dependent oxidoreductase (nitroreductase family)